MQEQESIKSIPSNRLQFFPIMMFATIMGLVGLTLVYKRVSEVLFMPSFFSTIMMVIYNYGVFYRFIFIF